MIKHSEELKQGAVHVADASQSARTVRAAAFRSLSLENAFSIGLKWGLYGGRNSMGARSLRLLRGRPRL